jgi:coenzyme F420-dependent glucose-6-phosphate dehydrogenase
MTIGFHASHEQFPPSALLAYARQAEAAGFDSVMSSEHIAPWSAAQGHSGNTWAWLGAAMQATSLPFGTLAMPGGWRYHPVVLAHAVATLAEIFPSRLGWIAAGSGEALNEKMVGAGWPAKDIRNARLAEGVEMMRALWRGETVTKSDGHIRAENARLWSLPAQTPKIYAAALTPETARWAAGWADGLITVHKPRDELRRVIDAFRDQGGGDKPVALQMHVSWAQSDEEARHQAWHCWRANTLSPEQNAELSTPEEFEAASAGLPLHAIDAHVLISSDLGRHTAWIEEYRSLAIDHLYLHNTGPNQTEFIDAFGETVLPQFKPR